MRWMVYKMRREAHWKLPPVNTLLGLRCKREEHRRGWTRRAFFVL